MREVVSRGGRGTATPSLVRLNAGAGNENNSTRPVRDVIGRSDTLILHVSTLAEVIYGCGWPMARPILTGQQPQLCATTSDEAKFCNAHTPHGAIAVTRSSEKLSAHKQEPWHGFWLLQKQVADALDACLDGLLVRTRQPSQAIEDVRPRLSRHTPMLE